MLFKMEFKAVIQVRKSDSNEDTAKGRFELIQNVDGFYFFTTRDGRFVGPFSSERQALEARNLFVYRIKYGRELPEMVATDMTAWQRRYA